MVLNARDHESLLKAGLPGAFGRIEYVEAGTYPVGVVLRVFDVRQFDSVVRVYFDTNREQVITGPRFALTRPPYKLYNDYGYRITSHIEFVKPIPDGVVALVCPTDATARAGINVLSPPMYPGFKGVVEYTVTVAANTELSEAVSVGTLVFFSMTGPTEDESEDESEPEAESMAPKKRSTKKPKPKDKDDADEKEAE